MKDKSNILGSNGDSGFLDSSIEESLLLTSEQERQSLTELNNRFAKYVEHVRQQEVFSSTAKSIEKLTDIPAEQLANLRTLFESEISNLRISLDQQSNDMAKLRIAHDKLEAEKCNQLSELQNKSHLINQLNQNLNNSKIECEILKSELDLLKDNETKASDLSKQLKECQNQLEIEVLLRTSADNACLTYREKMEFNEAVFKKELGALMTTHKNAIRKLSALQNNIASSNILEQMEEARKRLKAYLTELRSSIDDNFMKRIEETSNLVIKTVISHSNVTKDNDTLSHDNNELLLQLSKIKASHIKLENQLSDLESLHQEEINRLYRTISDISSSQIDELDQRLKSLSDLNQSLSKKSQLDTEIDIYRKMIESEEGRTNVQRSVDIDSPEIKKRRLSHVIHLQTPQSKSTPLANGRPIIRASRHHKSCNIM